VIGKKLNEIRKCTAEKVTTYVLNAEINYHDTFFPDLSEPSGNNCHLDNNI
jgi:hypothetical protein